MIKYENNSIELNKVEIGLIPKKTILEEVKPKNLNKIQLNDDINFQYTKEKSEFIKNNIKNNIHSYRTEIYNNGLYMSYIFYNDTNIMYYLKDNYDKENFLYKFNKDYDNNLTSKLNLINLLKQKYNIISNIKETRDGKIFEIIFIGGYENGSLRYYIFINNKNTFNLYIFLT